MPNESELILHRCAIYGSSMLFPGYSSTLDYLKETIGQAIADDYTTFITAARDGYELDAAQFICMLKSEYPKLKLVIVQPYLNRDRFWKTIPVFQELCSKADMVKYITVPGDPDALVKTDLWIVSHCSRIICTTNSPSSRIERIQRLDLSGKECVNVACIWSKEKEKYIHADLVEPKKVDQPDFPENLLCDLLNIKWAEYRTKAEEFPEDIAKRIDYVISLLEKREVDILKYRYDEKLTLQEIGENCGVSRERIRQILIKTMRKLRHPSRMNYLRGTGNKPTCRVATKGNDNLPSEDNESVGTRTLPTTNMSAVGFPAIDKGKKCGEQDKWIIWTEEEKSEIQQEIRNMTLDEVANEHGQTPTAIARLIKTSGMLSEEQFSQYCREIEPEMFHEDDRINSYELWTEEEERHLWELYNDGYSLTEIASAHERTTGAIVTRLAVMTGRTRKEILSHYENETDSSPSNSSDSKAEETKKTAVSKWIALTEEEKSEIQQDLNNLPLSEVAQKHGRQPQSIARVIKKYGMLSDEQFDQYCSEILPLSLNSLDRINSHEKWTSEEEKHLLNLYEAKVSLPEMADAHGRTEGAIVARLAKLTGLERDEIRKRFKTQR